ncbi:MAG: glutamine-hydrolyzing GMP synthase [Bacteroidota bacterium]
MEEKVLIFDFGSQYTQLIARRIRELKVYSEIVPFNAPVAMSDDIKAVILSGSPFSVREKDAPAPNLEPFLGKVPILAICYGAQFMAQHFGGEVARSATREYGKAKLDRIHIAKGLLEGIDAGSQVWMSHGDTIVQLPDHFELLASTRDVEVAAFQAKDKAFDAPVYCLQFHPEVYHSLDGSKLLGNFVIGVAGCSCSWTPAAFVTDTVEQLQQQIGNEKVLLGLSGGVDSSVAAMLLHKAIGDRLFCFFIDNGLLRKDEFEEVQGSYQGMGLNVTAIDAKQRFYDELAGLSDPEAKRKTIGRVFIEVFEEEAKKLDGISWLGQGTIYPDVIESVSVHGPSATIKSHHNVGGLPERMDLKIVEPLRQIFKDEVRRVGSEMGMPKHLLGRHPFPGPGLAIRILGDITAEKVALLQAADKIYIDKLREYDLYDQVWQAGTILLPVQSVGVMGDERTYEQAVALRAVNSTDGMTAEWSRLPYDFLADVSSEIINNVKGINRVVYDISTKPPATIEWE